MCSEMLVDNYMKDDKYNSSRDDDDDGRKK